MTSNQTMEIEKENLSSSQTSENIKEVNFPTSEPQILSQQVSQEVTIKQGEQKPYVRRNKKKKVSFKDWFEMQQLKEQNLCEDNKNQGVSKLEKCEEEASTTENMNNSPPPVPEKEAIPEAQVVSEKDLTSETQRETEKKDVSKLEKCEEEASTTENMNNSPPPVPENEAIPEAQVVSEKDLTSETQRETEKKDVSKLEKCEEEASTTENMNNFPPPVPENEAIPEAQVVSEKYLTSETQRETEKKQSIKRKSKKRMPISWSIPNEPQYCTPIVDLTLCSPETKLDTKDESFPETKEKVDKQGEQQPSSKCKTKKKVTFSNVVEIRYFKEEFLCEDNKNQAETEENYNNSSGAYPKHSHRISQQSTPHVSPSHNDEINYLEQQLEYLEDELWANDICLCEEIEKRRRVEKKYRDCMNQLHLYEETLKEQHEIEALPKFPKEQTNQAENKGQAKPEESELGQIAAQEYLITELNDLFKINNELKVELKNKEDGLQKVVSEQRQNNRHIVSGQIQADLLSPYLGEINRLQLQLNYLEEENQKKDISLSEQTEKRLLAENKLKESESRATGIQEYLMKQLDEMFNLNLELGEKVKHQEEQLKKLASEQSQHQTQMVSRKIKADLLAPYLEEINRLQQQLKHLDEENHQKNIYLSDQSEKRLLAENKLKESESRATGIQEYLMKQLDNLFNINLELNEKLKHQEEQLKNPVSEQRQLLKPMVSNETQTDLQESPKLKSVHYQDVLTQTETDVLEMSCKSTPGHQIILTQTGTDVLVNNEKEEVPETQRNGDHQWTSLPIQSESEIRKEASIKGVSEESFEQQEVSIPETVEDQTDPPTNESHTNEAVMFLPPTIPEDEKISETQENDDQQGETLTQNSLAVTETESSETAFEQNETKLCTVLETENDTEQAASDENESCQKDTVPESSSDPKTNDYQKATEENVEQPQVSTLQIVEVQTDFSTNDNSTNETIMSEPQLVTKEERVSKTQKNEVQNRDKKKQPKKALRKNRIKAALLRKAAAQQETVNDQKVSEESFEQQEVSIPETVEDQTDSPTNETQNNETLLSLPQMVLEHEKISEAQENNDQQVEPKQSKKAKRKCRIKAALLRKAAAQQETVNDQKVSEESFEQQEVSIPETVEDQTDSPTNESHTNEAVVFLPSTIPEDEKISETQENDDQQGETLTQNSLAVTETVSSETAFKHNETKLCTVSETENDTEQAASDENESYEKDTVPESSSNPKTNNYQKAVEENVEQQQVSSLQIVEVQTDFSTNESHTTEAVVFLPPTIPEDEKISETQENDDQQGETLTQNSLAATETESSETALEHNETKLCTVSETENDTEQAASDENESCQKEEQIQKAKSLPEMRIDVVEDVIPEPPQGLETQAEKELPWQDSGSEELEEAVKKVSLWRRVKKSLTPSHKRQHKADKRKIQTR